MYKTYWGLQGKPFENTPDPRFLYHSRQHNEALARLLYVVQERKGAVLLTGDYGSGKTLLTRVLWQELQQENKFHCAFLLNPRLSGLEFIQEITSQLSGAPVNGNKIELFHTLHQILYSNFNAGKHTVIIIDEAQAIKETDIFEELRLLLNFQLDDSFLLTIILIGQPELRSIVISLPQLMQRMSAKFHLKALSKSETKEYIQHRLCISGASRPIFTLEAHNQIYNFSSGIPRVINNICDLALLVGFGNGLISIDENIIIEVGKDLDFSVTPKQKYIDESKSKEELPLLDDSQDILDNFEQNHYFKNKDKT